MPVFQLTLHKTYYSMGFFNVTVDFDRYVGEEEPVKIILGDRQELAAISTVGQIKMVQRASWVEQG